MPTKINNINIINGVLNDFNTTKLSKKDIALKYKLSRPTIQRILNEANLSRVGRLSQIDIDNVISNSKYNITTICDIVNLDKMTVSKILKMKNITPFKKKRLPYIHHPRIKRYDVLKNTVSIEEMKKLLERSVYYAASQTGFSSELIKQYAIEHNIKFKLAYRTIHTIDISSRSKICKLYKEGNYTNKKLCEMFDIGSKTFRKIVKDVVKDHTNLSDPSFQKYKTLVRRLTTVVKNSFNIIVNIGQHVDHKLSVYDGYHQNIPAYLIASVENLEILNSIDNLKKGNSSSITKDELYRLIGV